MTVTPYAAPGETYGDDLPLPGRPRRRWWTPWTGALLALLLGAIGFYAGVRVEKGQVNGAAGAAGAAAARPASGFAGLAARFGGGGSGTFGTVSAVSANSLYVTDASGNTVKVTFNTATKVTKSVGVAKKAIRPGDTVVIQGLKNSSGDINATSVTDNGVRASGAGTRGGGSTSNSASSAVNSLFGGG